MSLLTLCKQSANIERRSESNQASGGIGATWSTVYTGLACSIQVYTGKTHGHVAPHFDQMQVRVDYQVYFPGSVDLQVNDRVVSDSVTYLVNGSGDMAGRNKVTVGYLTRVDQ
jgi:hypothetical protein